MKLQTTLCWTRCFVFILFFFFSVLPLTAQVNCVEFYGIVPLSSEHIQVTSFSIDDSDLSNITTRSSNNADKLLVGGTATVDPTNRHIYFVEANENGSGEFPEQLVIVETNQGTIGEFPMINLRELEYHCSKQQLYGLRTEENGQVEMLLLQPTFSPDNLTTTSLGDIILTNGHQLLIGSSTFDDVGGRYFFASTDNNGNYTVYTITIGGVGINRQTAAITTPILDLNYHSGLDQLMTLTSDLDLIGLAANDPTVVTTFGRVAGVFEIGDPFGIAIDPLVENGGSGELFFFMEDNSTYKFYGVDIINSPTITPRSNRFLDGPILDAVSAIPCKARADFDHVGTCVNDPVAFNDLSIGATSWFWDFGDSGSDDNTSVLPNPTHVYPTLGTYRVRLEIQGCVGTTDTTIQIEIVAPPTIPLPSDTTICGSSITLDAGSEPDVLYQWGNGGQESIQTFTSSGTFSVTAVRKRCIIRQEITVILAGETNTTEISFIDLNVAGYCEGDLVLLNPDVTGDAYFWSTNETTPTIEVTTGGTYQVTITDGNCVRTGEAVINFASLPPFTLGTDIDTCAQSIQLTPRQADGDIPTGNYRWSTGSTEQSINTDISGTYAVEISIGEGCRVSDTVEVLIGQPFTNDDDLLGGADEDGDGRGLLVGCVSSSFTFDHVFSADDLNNNTDITWTGGPANSTEPLTFISSDPEITIDPNAVVSPYLVHVLAVRGNCRAEDEAVIEFVADFGAFDIIAGADPIRLCNGESIYLAPNVRDVNYAWSTGEGTDSILVSTSGTYSVTISNGGCTSSSSVEVIVQPPTPAVDLGGPHQLCLETSTPLLLDANGTGNFVDYMWSPTGETTASILVSTPGTYTVEAIDANGCTTTGVTEVEELCAAKVVIPTAFSPNNDNMNDKFKIVGQFIETFKLQIFNRWGQILVETEDIEEGWDGNFSEEPQPSGVYIWLLTFTDNAGITKTQQGNIYLVR